MADEAFRLFNAARFAARSYFRLAQSDLSEEEIDEIKPPSLGDSNKAFRIAVLSLLVHNTDESRSAIRDLLHRGESELSDEDLDRIAWLLEGIAGSVTAGQMLAETREAANKWAGLSRKQDQRYAVLCCLAEAASPIATDAAAERCKGDLVTYDGRFEGLAVSELRDQLRRVEVAGNGGGRHADGTPRIGLHGLAAKLSVAVSAFGDTNPRSAKGAFEEAWSKGEERRLEMQKAALADVEKVERRNRKA